MWESVGSRVASMAYGNAGPYLFGLSLASSLNVIGAWMIVTPLFRASSASLAERSSMPVAAIDSLTASWSLPPSVVNSFWYSTRSSAVFEASMALPPFASAAEKTRSAGTTVSAARSAAPRVPAWLLQRFASTSSREACLTRVARVGIAGLHRPLSMDYCNLSRTPRRTSRRRKGVDGG